MQKILPAVLFVFLTSAASYGQSQEQEKRNPLQIDEAGSELKPGQRDLVAASLQGQLSVFRENKGQMPAHIRYANTTGKRKLFLMNDGIAFGDLDLTVQEINFDPEKAKDDPSFRPHHLLPKAKMHYTTWTMHFAGMNPNCKISAENPTESYINYLYSADPAKNATYVYDYDKVRYSELYKGIDLVYYASNDRLKYDFLVKPGASPASIRLSYEGVEGLSIDTDGRLHISTPSGDQVEEKPYCYQVIQGEKKVVASRYKLIDTHTYGFEITGSYNPAYPLVIDPIFLHWSTYFGNPGTNNYLYINGITVDSLGFSYITGATYNYYWWGNNTFPTTPGAYDTTCDGYMDAFVTKLNNAGSALVFSTLAGGLGYDWGIDITTNKVGAVFISGITYPNMQGPFPNTVNYTTVGSDYDIYAAQISAQGDRLIYSVLTGGANWEYSNSIYISPRNELYVTGTTFSADLYTSPLAYRRTMNGQGDIFLFRVNSAGTFITYSTYLGGNAAYGYYETPAEVIVSETDRVYLLGTTISNDLPTTSNAYKTTNSGAEDMFFMKLNPNALPAAQIEYCTYLGTSGRDMAFSFQMVKNNAEFLIGGGSSSGAFPGVINSYAGGTFDGVVLDLDITKTGSAQLIKSRYIGGSLGDMIRCVRMNRFGSIYVAGGTFSTNLPVTSDGYDTSFNGSIDAFFFKLNRTMDTIKLGSYFGGSGNDFSFWGIEYYYYNWFGRPYMGLNTADCIDKLAFGVPTTSNDFPTTQGAYMTYRNSGYYGAAVVMFKDTLGIFPTVNLGPDTIFCKGFTYTLDAGNASQGFKYRWNISETDTFQHWTATTAGTYYVDVYNICSFRRDSVIIKHKDPEVNFTDIPLICGSFSIVATAGLPNPGTRYRWSTGDTVRQITIRGGGDYWVIATNYCSSDTDTISIGQRFVPAPKLGKDTILCDGSTYTLNSGEPNSKYIWNDNPVDSFQTKTVASPGTYWVKVTNPCGNKSDTIVIDTLRTPILKTFKDTTTCNTVNLPLSVQNPLNKKVKYQWDNSATDTLATYTVTSFGQHTVQISNFCATLNDTFVVQKDSSPVFDLGPEQKFCKVVATYLDATYPNALSYRWSNGATTPGINPATPGLYKVDITNKCGTTRDSVQLTVIYEPVIPLRGDTLYCNSMNRLLDAGTDGDHYQWSTAASDTFSTITVSQPGAYWVDVTNLCGTFRDSIVLDISTKPVVNLGKDTIYCNGFSRQMDATFPYSTYAWNTTPVNTNPKITVNTPGVYEVTVTNPCGTTVKSVNIQQKFTPAIDLGKDTAYCGIMRHKLDATYPESRYIWNTGLAKDTLPTLMVTKTGYYEVKVTNYCASVTDGIYLTENPFPKVNLGNDTSICDGVAIKLDAGDDGDTYYWQPSGNTDRYEEVQYFGTYVATVINQYGCAKTDTFKVLSLCPPRVFVPSAFSPNGADTKVNEVFKPSYMYVDGAEFAIYDRWGEKIFATNDITKGWDGKVNGTDAPQGMYFWKLTYRGYKTESNLTGYVVLIR